MSQNRKQHLFYKNGQLASQIASDHAVTVFSVSNTLLAEQRSEGRSARISLLAVDLQSSVLNNSHRDSTHALAYTAYGHSKTLHGTASLMGFTGQRYDDIANCYLLGNGYRGFNPQIMRFLSSDSFSPFGSRTLNAYAYCAGDPINRNDPSGHIFKHIKAVFSTPRIHYLTKARSAIAEHPNLAKYSIIADDPKVSIDKLKAIYRIPKAEKMLEQHMKTALENLTTAQFEKYTQNRTSKLDYKAFLDFDDSLNYMRLESKIIKYRGMLDNFVSSSHETNQPVSVASPQAERAAIRSSWETFED